MSDLSRSDSQAMLAEDRACAEIRRKRDQRAATIVELLRLGHDPKKVSAAVEIADAGGSVYDAMEALR
jgi:hypothetical protein